MNNIWDMAKRHVSWVNLERGKYRSELGERCYLAKLTNKQAVQVIKRVNRGESQASVARRFGVTRNAIWNLLHGRAWSRLLKEKLLISCE